MELYLVRHGETQYNKEGRIQGHVDSELTDSGKEVIKKSADYLANIEFDNIYSSPQKRAVSTAEIINRANQFPKKIQTKELLAEMSFGDWDGQLEEEFAKNNPEAFYNLKNNPEKYNPKDYRGESYEEVAKRGIEQIKKIVAIGGNRSLVVSHGVLLMTVINSFQKTPLSQFRARGIINNASITILQFDKLANFEEVKLYNYSPK